MRVFRTNHSEVKKLMQSRFVFGSQMKINNTELKVSVAKFGLTLLLSSYYKPLCLLLKRICVKLENLRQINLDNTLYLLLNNELKTYDSFTLNH